MPPRTKFSKSGQRSTAQYFREISIMKKLFISVMAILACVPSWAEWSLIGETNGRNFYFDQASIRIEGGLRTAWTMSDALPKIDPALEDIKNQHEDYRRWYSQYKSRAKDRAWSAYASGLNGVPGTAARLHEESVEKDRIQEQEFQRRELLFNNVMRASQQSDSGGVRSVTTKSEYDCKNLRFKMVTLNQYTDPMGRGEPIKTFGPSPNWVDVVPYSVGEKLRMRICGAASTDW
jgi:hypothetical protein